MMLDIEQQWDFQIHLPKRYENEVVQAILSNLSRRFKVVYPTALSTASANTQSFVT
jgi:hypothetical protein